MRYLRFAMVTVAALSFGGGVACWASAAVLPTVSDVPHLRFRDLGEASAALPVSLTVTLNYRNPEQLERLIAVQNDPSSPYYRHWLTSEQFNAAFAPSGQEYDRVATAFARAGFRVTGTFSNRTVVDLRGTVGLAERYFGTRIDRVAQPGYGLRYANVRAAFVPSELRDSVFSVSGLNDLVTVRTTIARVPRQPGRLSHVDAEANATKPRMYGPVSSATGLRGLAPLAFATAYDFPILHTAKTGSYNGTGRAGAIVIDADFSDADLAAYLAYFKIERTGKTVRVAVDGGPAASPPATSSVEAALDVETIAAGAPGATLYVYEVPTLSQNTTDAYNAVVAQNKADTVNSSFGGCEIADPSLTKAWDHIALQGTALGMTFHAASGDSGAYECAEQPASASKPIDFPGVSAPASSPHFVAVGGTSLYLNTNGSRLAEYGWGGNTGASGGGVSVVFTMPAWQKGVANMQAWYRNVPDVSFDANPITGTAFYYGGSWNTATDPLGGTSLASPLFGVAQLQMDQLWGTRAGLSAKALFTFWKAHSYAKAGTVYFYDITYGYNYLYTALPGYDNVTGIGSEDVWNIAEGLK